MAIAPEDDHQGSEEADLRLPDDELIPESETVHATPKQQKNYEIAAPVASPLTDEAAAKFEDIMIPVLPDTASACDEALSDTKQSVDASEETVNWYQGIVQGFRSHPSKGVFEDALANPNADWRNSLQHNGQNVNIGRPKFSNKGRGSRMSSERLELSIRSTLGLGAPIQVPLVGSGFYATIRPMGEDEIIALWREVIAETVRLGRITHGLIFSNNQVFAAKAMFQAFVNTMFQTTVSDLPNENLADHLTINDLPIIAHAVATSIYPNGLPVQRSVFTEDGNNMPKEEIKQLIDIRKCLFMNAKMFKDEQLAHMVKRIEKPMTLKMVKEYRDQFVFNQSTVVDITDTIKLHLHTPSLREYFESGEKWVNEILAIVHEAMGADAEERKRMQYISQLALATRLRQYSHYVKAIEEDGELYSTRENVDKILNTISSSNELSGKIFKAISDYINNTQVAIVATTSVNSYEDTLSGDKWPRLIPLDAISVFFQLVEQKLRGITSRTLEDT